MGAALFWAISPCPSGSCPPLSLGFCPVAAAGAACLLTEFVLVPPLRSCTLFVGSVPLGAVGSCLPFAGSALPGSPRTHMSFRGSALLGRFALCWICPIATIGPSKTKIPPFLQLFCFQTPRKGFGAASGMVRSKSGAAGWYGNGASPALRDGPGAARVHAAE